MANQRDIKRRIKSVVNTQKITKAMKLVAAAKFARASHAVNASRPYSSAFESMVQRLVAGAGAIDSDLVHQREEKKVLLVVVATDRGLCGGLNTNLFKKSRRWLAEQNTSVDLVSWGRKANSWANKQGKSIIDEREKVTDNPRYDLAKELAASLVNLYRENEYDAVYVAFNEFKNALTQIPLVKKVLPVTLDASEETDTSSSDFIVEPSLAEMFDSLMERRLASFVFQVLLEAAASEHGSRMTAMDSATSNAGKVRKKLTLAYNRARQASITKELIEIISGAEAL